MTCHYCQKECAQLICLFCDGKFIARDVFKELNISRTIVKSRNPDAYFDEFKTLESIKAKRMQGIDKLSQEERLEFMAGYTAEWGRLLNG